MRDLWKEVWWVIDRLVQTDLGYQLGGKQWDPSFSWQHWVVKFVHPSAGLLWCWCWVCCKSHVKMKVNFPVVLCTMWTPSLIRTGMMSYATLQLLHESWLGKNSETVFQCINVKEKNSLFVYHNVLWGAVAFTKVFSVL